ncbi:MAG TPA: regulatory iron-sulfur-containing complex subunit RicT [Kofleriaceae bacterium]
MSPNDASDGGDPGAEREAGPTAEAGTASEGAQTGEAGEPRKRRRRRRRREPGEAGADEPRAAAEPQPAQAQPQPAQPQPAQPLENRSDNRPRRDWNAKFADQPPRTESRNEPRPESRNEQRRDQPRNRPERSQRADRPREPQSERPREPQSERREPRREPREARRDRPQPAEAPALPAQTFEHATPRLQPRAPTPHPDDEPDAAAAPAVAWGKDDDGPPPEVTLAADLPADAPADDPDPTTFPLADQPSAVLGDDVASVTGVRYVAGGRIQWCDAGDADYARGERVLVDAERGTRLAWIAVPPARKPVRERGLRRVIRRANDQDLRAERDAGGADALRIAKDKAAALRLPLKVFRVESLGPAGRGGRVNVYYTTDERLDLRDFIRDVSSALGGGRIELRQLGVRDEAKAVGGIGSCGLTLCCTTWLPDFVPVSIKMAKDQGLVLSPTKVSGQCGRLKCCLVYEQAAYAELRKGLPKLGKRVIGARGEGRVVEVDVLRQRIRVSYGPGDTEVVPAGEVKPLFPSGNQPPRPAGDDAHDAPEPDDAHDAPEPHGAPEPDDAHLPELDPTALPDDTDD